jgi:hypothetical protein
MVVLWRKFRFIIFICLFACAVPVTLTAQFANTIAVVKSGGGDFTLIRDNGIDGNYSPSDISRNGLILRDSDTIQTPSGVFVEAHAYPSGTSVRIAENSFVTFVNIGGSSMIQVISLIYGRVRIDHRNSSEAILLRAGSSITEIKKGSVNFDLLMPPDDAPGGGGSRLLLYVSAISGSALFLPPVMSRDSQQIKLKKNEALIFNTETGQITRRPMDKAIAGFWDGDVGKNTAPAGFETADNDISLKFGDSYPERQKTSTRWKTVFLISGVVLIAAGVAMQNWIHYNYSALIKENADTIHYIMYAPIAGGAAMMLGAYFYRLR